MLRPSMLNYVVSTYLKQQFEQIFVAISLATEYPISLATEYPGTGIVTILERVAIFARDTIIYKLYKAKFSTLQNISALNVLLNLLCYFSYCVGGLPPISKHREELKIRGEDEYF